MKLFNESLKDGPTARRRRGKAEVMEFVTIKSCKSWNIGRLQFLLSFKRAGCFFPVLFPPRSSGIYLGRVSFQTATCLHVNTLENNYAAAQSSEERLLA